MHTLVASLLLVAGLGLPPGPSPDLDAAPPSTAPPSHPVPPADTVTVAVQVSGAESEEGRIVVALFASADGFPRDVAKAAYTTSTPAQGKTASVQVEGVEPGRYAVMAFHDADGNGEVDTNWVGMPKEGVAAANWTGGRPKFDESAITIDADTPPLALTLRYR